MLEIEYKSELEGYGAVELEQVNLINQLNGMKAKISVEGLDEFIRNAQRQGHNVFIKTQID